MSPDPLYPIGPDPSREPDLRYVVRQWLGLYACHLRASSLRQYEAVTRILLAHLGGLRPSEVTPLVAIRFAHARIQAGAAPSTAARDWKALRRILAWGAETLGTANPLRDARKPPMRSEEPRNPARPFTDDEVARVYEIVRQDDARRRVPQYPLYLTLAETGARIGELIGSIWAALDLDREELVVSASLSKTHKARVIPLAPPVVPELRRLVPIHEVVHERPLRGDDRVFLSPTGRPLHPRNQSMYLDRVLERAGIDKRDEQGRRVSAHSFRHALVTRLASKGVSAELAAHMVGHASPSLTRRVYTHLRTEHLRAALAERAWGYADDEGPPGLAENQPVSGSSDASDLDGVAENGAVVVRHPAQRRAVLVLSPEDMPPDQYRRLLAALARGVAVLLVGPDWRTE